LWPGIVEMTIQFGQKSAETLRCSVRDAELFKDHAGAGFNRADDRDRRGSIRRLVEIGLKAKAR
jgi:hypothetical protein